MRSVVRFGQHSVTKNAAALLLVQASRILIPIITLPFLTRVLSATHWGLVVFAQSFALWLSLVIEFGFTLSATRAVARSRDDPESLRTIVAGVLGANMLLASLSILVALLTTIFLPYFRERPALLFWSWILALAQGALPVWYFQGLERLSRLAARDVSLRLAGAILIVAFVRQPNSAAIVIGLQAVAASVSTAYSMRIMVREVSPVPPAWAHTKEAIFTGWRMFLFRGSAGLFTAANGFLLGLFASPPVVGVFGGAERLVRFLLLALQPISQAVFPRVAYLLEQDPAQARRLARTSLRIMGSIGLLCGAAMFVLAPWLVSVFLGPTWDSAVPVLRVLSLIVPLVSVSSVFGLHWMLPRGEDRRFNFVFIAAGLLNVGLAALLATRSGASGMAWAIVVTETFVAIGLYVVGWRKSPEKPDGI